MDKKKKSIKILDAFLIFLIVLNTLPILAPILANLGLILPAKVIYTIYSFTCHQFHWRSLHIGGYQFAWCTRDTFIWGSFLLTTLAVKFNFLKKGLNWYWILLFTIPIALDGGIQTIATLLNVSNAGQFYLSTNLMRMITGSLFGMGLAAIIAPYLKEEQENL